MFATWRKTQVHVMTTVQSGTLSSTHEPVAASCMVDVMVTETSSILAKSVKTDVYIPALALLNLNLQEAPLFH